MATNHHEEAMEPVSESREGRTFEQTSSSSAGQDRVNRMGTANIPKLITEFAIPAIAGMLVNGAYNVIDSIFLGQAMGSVGLSATTVAMPIMIVFMAFAMLVGDRDRKSVV